MALKPGDVANFETLKRVFADGAAALVECTDQSGEYVATICAITVDEETDERVITPFARLFAGNPYDELVPPGAEETDADGRDERSTQHT